VSVFDCVVGMVHPAGNVQVVAVAGMCCGFPVAVLLWLLLALSPAELCGVPQIG